MLLGLHVLCAAQTQSSTVVYPCDECGSSGKLCIDDVLGNITNNSHIVLLSGVHQVKKFNRVEGKYNVTFSGSNMADTIIDCGYGKNVGLVFSLMNQLQFMDVTITNCSLTGQYLNDTYTEMI